MYAYICIVYTVLSENYHQVQKTQTCVCKIECVGKGVGKKDEKFKV